MGVFRDSRKFSRHPYIMAHRAVIFAIAQLSCGVRGLPCGMCLLIWILTLALKTLGLSELLYAKSCCIELSILSNSDTDRCVMCVSRVHAVLIGGFLSHGFLSFFPFLTFARTSL